MTRARVLVLIFLIGASSLQAQEITHASNEGFVYNAKGKHSFAVKVDLVPPDTRMRRPGHYYGRDGDIPGLVCSNFLVAIDGTNIALPPKACTDLGDITSVGSPDDIGWWSLTVEGGTAGGSYQVELIFNDKRLLERRFVDLFAFGQGQKYSKVEKF